MIYHVYRRFYGVYTGIKRLHPAPSAWFSNWSQWTLPVSSSVTAIYKSMWKRGTMNRVLCLYDTVWHIEDFWTNELQGKSSYCEIEYARQEKLKGVIWPLNLINLFNSSQYTYYILSLFVYLYIWTQFTIISPFFGWIVHKTAYLKRRCILGHKWLNIEENTDISNR